MGAADGGEEGGSVNSVLTMEVGGVSVGLIVGIVAGAVVALFVVHRACCQRTKSIPVQPQTPASPAAPVININVTQASTSGSASGDAIPVVSAQAVASVPPA